MSCLHEILRVPISRRCDGYYLRWYYNGWHYWFFYPGKINFITEGEKYRTLGTRKMTIGTGQITQEQCDAIRTIMNTTEIYIFTDVGWGVVRVDPGTWTVYDHGIKGYEAEITITISSKYVSPTGFSPVEDVPVLSPVPYVPACGVIAIGAQSWLACNYDIAYPASKVYNNDEANRSVYGGLYTWNQIVAAGFCPSGWRVPTEVDWDILIAFVGDITDAGGILKEVGLTHWANPNTGATDAFSFKALPAGYYNYISNLYLLLTQYGYFWTLTESGSTALVIRMDYGAAGITKNYVDKNHFFPVRLLNISPLTPVYDLDGNEYTTVIIGTQEWTIQNWRCNRYANGVAIPFINNGGAWMADLTGARWDPSGGGATWLIYGGLYNWYAINNVNGICYLERSGIHEPGWRVPTRVDFENLATFAGGLAVAGGKLMESGLAHWNPGNIGTDNYGFAWRGAGWRQSTGGYLDQMDASNIWTATQDGALNAFDRGVQSGFNTMWENSSDKNCGYSVRMVRDI